MIYLETFGWNLLMNKLRPEFYICMAVTEYFNKSVKTEKFRPISRKDIDIIFISYNVQHFLTFLLVL